MIKRTLAELKDYLKLDKSPGDDKVLLGSLEIDSRRVKENDVFLAVAGHHSDGRSFIADAFTRGAAAVIAAADGENMCRNPAALSDFKELSCLKGQHEGRLLLLDKDPNQGDLASWYYGNPSAKLKILGVTGTNGKSTVTHMLSFLLGGVKRKCAVFGTLGWGFLGNLHKSANTTLNAVDLQKALAICVDEGAQWAAMEVSSIGVCENRLEGTTFRGAGFTNLTRDHLDYHKTLDAYFEAKKRFMQMVSGRMCVINDRDPRARSLYEACQGSIAYGTGSRLPNFIDQRYVWISSIDFLKGGLHLKIDSSFGSGECTLNLLGAFNAENFACALSMLLAQGFSLEELLKSAPLIKPVPGRMEAFSAPGKPVIVVDYAHTPDGVEQALKAMREHAEGGRISIVLGCGGDRDPGKRAIMAMKACVFADRVILTNDNPRTEDPDRIISDMLLGVPPNLRKLSVEKDRRKAILKAFTEAAPTDAVLVAGKGHEDYQIFKNETVHFSDREIAAELTAMEGQ